MSERYDFGRNWSAFSEAVSESAIAHAKTDLKRLVGDPAGKTFLDIGSGSGLHSLAALLLGAKKVVALDFDPDSVATSERVIQKHCQDGDWIVMRDDILAPERIPDEQFDIVYSWGVLHHTGDMWRAIENSLRYVATGGLFAVALYMKTPCCGLWWHEKRLYSRYRVIRPLVRSVYTMLMLARHAAKGDNPVGIIRNYSTQRGMSFVHDIDDWLGGFPYESVEAPELEAFLQQRSFSLERSFNTKAGIGLMGTGCGEWAFREMSHSK